MGNLPKFILGDSPDGRVFVVHLHKPRLLLELDDSGVNLNCVEIYESKMPTDAAELAKLMRQAGEFYLEEINRE
ncbi:MAG: hypothetical protein AAF546_00030 [Verrucomicrobiota bacterium]